MNASQELQRFEITYSGCVQGVGFRYTARRIAERFRVTGYVENLPDGRVKLVAEGERWELERFSGSVAAAMAENIDSSQTIESAASGEFRYFGVRH